MTYKSDQSAPLPVVLLISVGGATEPGRIVFTLRGAATDEDKAYYAALMLGVVEATKRKRKDEESWPAINQVTSK